MYSYLDLLFVKQAHHIGSITYFASQHGQTMFAYARTLQLNCNSISTKIVLIVSINFEELTRKKNYWF